MYKYLIRFVWPGWKCIATWKDWAKFFKFPLYLGKATKKTELITDCPRFKKKIDISLLAFKEHIVRKKRTFVPFLYDFQDSFDPET